MNKNIIPEIEKTLSVRLPKVYVDYMTEERAKAEMKMMKETSPRSEWNIDRLTVGECHWREGFVRDI